MISVFVYGTLLVGESNHYVAEPFLLSVQPGAVRGRLYDVGHYPALALILTNIRKRKKVSLSVNGLRSRKKD